MPDFVNVVTSVWLCLDGYNTIAIHLWLWPTLSTESLFIWFIDKKYTDNKNIVSTGQTRILNFTDYYGYIDFLLIRKSLLRIKIKSINL